MFSFPESTVNVCVDLGVYPFPPQHGVNVRVLKKCVVLQMNDIPEVGSAIFFWGCAFARMLPFFYVR